MKLHLDIDFVGAFMDNMWRWKPMALVISVTKWFVENYVLDNTFIVHQQINIFK